MFQTEYTKYGTTYNFLRKVMALPYLPHEQIPAAFDALRGQLREDQPKLQAFMAYVERQWIKHTTFTPSSWSVFKMSIRSNNDIEGYHFKLNRYFIFIHCLTCVYMKEIQINVMSINHVYFLLLIYFRLTGSKVGFYYILEKVLYKEVKDTDQKLKMVSEKKLKRRQKTETKTRNEKIWLMWER